MPLGSQATLLCEPKGSVVASNAFFALPLQNIQASHINGGRIVNADIVIKNGGSIIISNDALIEIREQGGNLNLENGANLNYIKGTIQ